MDGVLAVLTERLTESLQARRKKTEMPVDQLAAVVFGLFSGLVQLRGINRDAVPDDLFETALTALVKGLPSGGH